MTSLILPPKYSRCMLVSCQQALWYAYKYYTISHCPMMISSIILYTTSIIFWQHPVYSWRRNMDICVVQLTAFYTFYNAYECNLIDQYVLFNMYCFSGFWLYLIGCYVYKRKYLFFYTVCHIGLHTLSGFGNSVLIDCVQHPENSKNNIDVFKIYTTVFYYLFFCNYIYVYS